MEVFTMGNYQILLLKPVQFALKPGIYSTTFQFLLQCFGFLPCSCSLEFSEVQPVLDQMVIHSRVALKYITECLYFY